MSSHQDPPNEPSSNEPSSNEPPADAAVDPRRPGAGARERVEEGDEEAVERYADSPGAGLAGVLDDLPEPNEPG